MPIEIKELHIRVTVDNTPAQAPASATGSQPGQAPKVDKCAQDELVSDIVEQILQILQEKKER